MFIYPDDHGRTMPRLRQHLAVALVAAVLFSAAGWSVARIWPSRINDHDPISAENDAADSPLVYRYPPERLQLCGKVSPISFKFAPPPTPEFATDEPPVTPPPTDSLELRRLPPVDDPPTNYTSEIDSLRRLPPVEDSVELAPASQPVRSENRAVSPPTSSSPVGEQPWYNTEYPGAHEPNADVSPAPPKPASTGELEVRPAPRNNQWNGALDRNKPATQPPTLNLPTNGASGPPRPAQQFVPESIPLPPSDEQPRPDVSESSKAQGRGPIVLPPSNQEADLPIKNSPTGEVSFEPPQKDLAPPRPLGPDPQMRAVADRAAELVRHGSSLATRNAYWSARVEFIQALRLITQALDAAEGQQRHSQQLADAFQALAEADDFVPKGARLEANLDIQGIVAAHRTKVLKDADLADVTPLAALQRYYTFAQQQLTEACGNEPVASQALFSLGKLQMLVGADTPDQQMVNGPKAMAMHQAALMVDSNNYLAANELGVLLARFGQLGEAKSVLLHAVVVARQPESWHNLAVVHQRLGEKDMAERARYEWQLAMSRRQQAPVSDGPVQWLDAKAFARTGPQPAAEATAPRQAVAPPAKKAESPWWMPWK